MCRLVVVVLLTVLSASSYATPPENECETALSNGITDPYLWLEEIEGENALNWVREQNAQSLAKLESDPRYQALSAEAKEILFAKDRVPFSGFADGYFWNFWQDETHKHGILRKTTYDEYKKAEPTWETVIDLDALSAAEGENWVYKGAARLTPHSSRRLLMLSRGGKDADVIREFDYETHQFINDGFNVPEAKTDLAPVDENTVLIGTDFGPESMTTSGYARTIRLWRRGQPLAAAPVVFEVASTDMGAQAFVIRHGEEKHVCFDRLISFYEKELFILETDNSLRKVPLPKSASLVDIRGGKIYFELREAMDQFAVGAILSLDLEATSTASAHLVYQPQPGQSVSSVQVTAHGVYVNLLENIRSRVILLRPDGVTESLPFPATGVISFSAGNEDDPTSFPTMTYTDHLTPSRQYRVHEDRLEVLKSGPERFDPNLFEVTQNFATSADGTRVPYFLIKKKGLVYDGTHPTILYGYGGFEISLTPSYSGSIGKMWLERGGVYVVANIRGGGEFGPEWHQAALREHRQRAFDDFAAVAKDLITRGITSPQHLGIHGGSNGGLLTGTVMVQHPELFNAALVQVPLLDMMRYSKLLAGASWMAEYGDPDVAGDREFLLKYSPYQNVRAGVRYPTPMFTTSTKDDRVHPGHARKMAARMIEQGHPLLYYENINGGHAGSANLEETAHMLALYYTYFWQQLGGVMPR